MMGKKLSRQFMPGMRDQSLSAETSNAVNKLVIKNVSSQVDEQVFEAIDFADFENEIAACIRSKLNA